MRAIDGKKMKELMETNQAKAIDIDLAATFKKSHIQGAVNIPYSEQNFVNKVQKQFSKKSENIVLCGQKDCGTQLNRLAKDLEKAGYKNIYQYKSGPSDWKSSGLNVQ